jgi:hypothetical protein
MAPRDEAPTAIERRQPQGQRADVDLNQFVSRDATKPEECELFGAIDAAMPCD